MKASNICTIYEDENLLVQANTEGIRNSDRVLLSFTGIGHGMGGIDVQRIEFAGTARRHGGLIVVTDKLRSWGNNISHDHLASIILPLVRNKDVVTLGNSMGGFLAMLFASRLGARQAIAFAPQFSVSTRIMPDEPRWMEYRSKIETFRYPSLDGYLGKKTRYYTINGDTPLEMIHWKRFPRGPNLHHYILRDIGHDAALQLKKKGALDTVIKDALAERLSEESFQPAPAYRLPNGQTNPILSRIAGILVRRG